MHAKMLLSMVLLVAVFRSNVCHALTANRVWFEFLDSGKYRVSATYTLTELKELRSFYVIFTDKRKANEFYWALVRGADFHPDRPEGVTFSEPKLKPRPW